MDTRYFFSRGMGVTRTYYDDLHRATASAFDFDGDQRQPASAGPAQTITATLISPSSISKSFAP